MCSSPLLLLALLFFHELCAFFVYFDIYLFLRSMSRCVLAAY